MHTHISHTRPESCERMQMLLSDVQSPCHWVVVFVKRTDYRKIIEVKVWAQKHPPKVGECMLHTSMHVHSLYMAYIRQLHRHAYRSSACVSVCVSAHFDVNMDISFGHKSVLGWVHISSYPFMSTDQLRWNDRCLCTKGHSSVQHPIPLLAHVMQQYICESIYERSASRTANVCCAMVNGKCTIWNVWISKLIPVHIQI